MSRLRRSFRVSHRPRNVTITDPNTTIGQCRFDEAGGIACIVVGAAPLRTGIGMQWPAIVEARRDIPLRLQPPTSPLGQQLINACVRQQRRDQDLPTRG
jgi:hypothetical protein